MKKLVITAIVISLLFLNLFLISAEENLPSTPIPKEVNILEQFLLNFQYKIGLFTVVGRDRQCGIKGPISYTGPPKSNVNQPDSYCSSTSDYGCPNYVYRAGVTSEANVAIARTDLQSLAGCTQALINTFRANYDYIGEFNLPDYSTIYVPSGGYIQVYCCPHPKCTKNSDCTDWGTGTTCNTGTGVCSGTATWKTKTYTCTSSTGTWRYDGEVSSGNSRFCSWGSTYNNYVIPAGESSGVCYTSPPEGWCTQCIADCSADSTVCLGQTFSDGCGGTCTGTKDCSGTDDDVTPTCGNGICEGDETTTCPNDCGTPTTDDLSKVIQVSNIKLPSYPETLNPFQGPQHEKDFKVTLKNTDSKVQVVNVEAGFYTYNYAKNVAKLYSIFSTVAPQPIANCVGTEPFVKTIAVTLQPGETKTVTIKESPINAYVTYPVGEGYILDQIKLTSFLGVMKHAGENACCKKLTNFEGCVEGTGGYIDSKYDPNYYVSDNSLYLTTSPITCGGAVYGKIDYKAIGKDTLTISKSYKDCIEYEFYTENGTIDKNATRNYLESIGSFEGLKKISLTKEQISTLPTQDLIASACLSSSECSERSNYSVSCIRLNKLKEEGLIGETEVKDMANKAKVTFAYAGVGAGGFLTICAVSGLVTGGAGLVACGVGGALVGAAGGYALTEVAEGVGDFFSSDDALTKAIKSGDSTSYGICTAEPKFNYCQYVEWAGFYTFPGTSKCLSGLIIIIIGLGIISFIFKAGGKK